MTAAINSISAVTLATHDLGRAVRFYLSLAQGGAASGFAKLSSWPSGSVRWK